MLKKDVVILGGGASALMCAINIAPNRKVTILEKNDKIGKPILATGNGRCNLTNTQIDVSVYNNKVVQRYFDRFGSAQTIELFRSRGLEVYADSEGRVYPISDTATSVLDVLRLKCNSLGVEEIVSVGITSIESRDNKYIIKSTTHDTIECNTLVLATGGNSSEKYLKELGLSYIPYRKSLGSLKSDKNKGLNGVRVGNVCATLEIGEKKYSQNGEILFKDDAISGILVFNLSAYFAWNNVSEAYVKVDFMKDYTMSDLIDYLTIRKNQMKDYIMTDYFTGLFHKAVGQSILERSGIDRVKRVGTMTASDIKNIATAIKEYRIKVYGVLDNNQVHTGGVVIDNLDDNMKYKGTDIYVIGELVDVDALCGGYNLQWAWTSGYLAGKDIK